MAQPTDWHPHVIGRRGFLKRGALGGAAAALVGTRDASVVRAGAIEEPADAREFELEEISVAQLQDGMSSGQLRRGRDLAQAYLDAHRRPSTRHGPALRCVIELNPDAAAIAEALDGSGRRGEAARAAARHPRPAQGQHRHRRPDDDHRRLARAGRRPSPPRDAFVVERLRAAGAVILGKTNLSEWANFRSTHSTSGWSGRGGQTPQPLRARPQPLRLELGLRRGRRGQPRAPSAVGTETDGSIVCPSSAMRRWSASSRPSAWSAAPASSPSRTARTPPGRWRAPWPTPPSLLGALAGVDPRDAATARAAASAHADYTQFLDADGLRARASASPREVLRLQRRRRRADGRGASRR